jgi:putative oxidoreductase
MRGKNVAESSCPITCGTKCYDWTAHKIDLLQPLFLLLARLYIGYQSIVAGWAHLHHVEQTAKFFASLGIPMPTLNVYIAGTTEVVGGALIALGLAARLAAIPFTFNFLIAILSVDLSSNTLGQLLHKIYQDQDIILKDDAFPFFFVGLMILIFGPGVISLDYLVLRPLFHRKQPSPKP